jgi:hypothetical protein
MQMLSLRGVEEAAPKLDDRIDEIHGMWDYNAGALRRLDGKLLNSTGGSFWTLAQLNFRGRRAFVNNNNGSNFIVDDGQPLPGVVFPYPVYPNQHPGYSFWADWPSLPNIDPNNPIEGQETPGGDSPSGPTGDEPDDSVPMGLTPTPEMVEFDTRTDRNGASRTIRVKKSDATNGGGSFVRVSWNSGLEWMSLRYLGSAPISRDISNGDLVPLGAWISQDSHDIIIQVTARPGRLAGRSGTHTKSIVFTVTEANGSYPAEGTTSCAAVAKLVARSPEIDMLTEPPVWNQAVKDAT